MLSKGGPILTKAHLVSKVLLLRCDVIFKQKVERTLKSVRFLHYILLWGLGLSFFFSWPYCVQQKTIIVFNCLVNMFGKNALE